MDQNIEKWFLVTNHLIETRPRLKNDIQANLHNFPSLHLTSVTFQEQGIPNKVLALEGQIQVNYNNTQYGVPLICILPVRYPYSPPVFYIRNPPNTRLEPSTYMTAEGQVTHPLLLQWDSKKSSISAAIREISKVFEQYFPIVACMQPSVPAPVKGGSGLYPNLYESERIATQVSNNQPHKHFRIDRHNPMHSTYFAIEEQENWLEKSIQTSYLDLCTDPTNSNQIVMDLKKKFIELFILNRKKEKCILLLSKLG